MDRPEAKNAIGKEMLHGLRNVLELINQNSDANVAMIRSSVAGVFCAGADLKVYCFSLFGSAHFTISKHNLKHWDSFMRQ